MAKNIYRYKFIDTAPPEEIEASLLLAVLATESLHGESQVRLDAAHYFDFQKRVGVIDARSTVGRDLNRLFTGFIGREFGPDAFKVERITDFSPQTKEATE